MKNVVLGIVVGVAVNSLAFAVGDVKMQGSPSSPTTTPSGAGNTGSGPSNPATTPTTGIGSTGSGPAVAPTNSNPVNTPPVQRTPSGITRVNGTVLSIDRSSNRVRVRDSQGQTTEFTVNDQTNFVENGRVGKFSNINPGDRVILDSNPDLGVMRFELQNDKK